jgi:uncharacterized protein
VKLPDANFLLYAVDKSAPPHRPGAAVVGANPVWYGNGRVRLGGAPRVLAVDNEPASLRESLDPQEAFDLVEDWVAQPSSTIVYPTDRHAAVLRELLQPLGTAGNLTTDAHLAALAIEHGAELCSFDSDFSRFPGLSRSDPLS